MRTTGQFCFAVLLTVALSFAVPLSHAAGTTPIILSEAQNGKSTTVSKDTTFTVQLSGNPTTGYSWSLFKLSGNSLKSNGKITYTATPVKPGIVGSGGTFTAPFKAVAAGKSTITMQYARPWEHVPPVKIFTVTVVVTAAK